MVIVMSATAVLAAWFLLVLGIEPVPTWFYVFAWYPTLVLLDAVATRLDGRPSALWRPSALSLFAWSPVVWLVFEAANFRLLNWYYIFLPHSAPERWAGILLSFATVLPALVLAERALHAAGLFVGWKSRPVKVRKQDLQGALVLGIGMALLSLTLPKVFFPLIWGAGLLIADPLVYRLQPQYSLIADLERGEWGRVCRLLLDGMAIGLIWETYNFWARGKWVYTVPWLEDLKLFEMPPFGFVGFPFFALEAWAIYHALCALGVALPAAARARLASRPTTLAGLTALVLSVTILWGMERRTISSTVPSLAQLPGIGEQQLERIRSAGISSVFELAHSTPATLVSSARFTEREAATILQLARLVTLRGIGTEHGAVLNAIGLSNVCLLAGEDPGRLHSEVSTWSNGVRPTMAEVRV